jgi:hypothetical protein
VNTVEAFTIKQFIIAPQPRAVLRDLADYVGTFVSLFAPTVPLPLTSNLAQVVTFLICIIDVPGSNLDGERGLS